MTKTIRSLTAVSVLASVIATSSASAADPRSVTKAEYLAMEKPAACRVVELSDTLSFSGECFRAEDPDSLGMTVKFGTDGKPVAFFYRMKEGTAAAEMTDRFIRANTRSAVVARTDASHTAVRVGNGIETLEVRRSDAGGTESRLFIWTRF